MVNSVKQISQFIEERKSAKRTVWTAWHHAAQLINKWNCSLVGSQGYPGYHRYKGCEKRKDLGPTRAQIWRRQTQQVILGKALSI